MIRLGVAAAALTAVVALVGVSVASSATAPNGTPSIAFSPTGPMTVIRNRAIAAALPDGKVLVAGGEDMNTWSSAETYDPTSGSFSAVGIGSMAKPLQQAAAAALPDGDVLIAGGVNPPNSPIEPEAELYNPVTQQFSTAGLGAMTAARDAPAAAALPTGDVLIVGGADGRGTVLSSAEIFNPATLQFSSTGLGDMTAARLGAIAAPLQDGKVLVAGGITRDGTTASAELFDPGTGQFSSDGIGQMTAPRVFAMAAPLPDGEVLIAGGTSGDGVPLASAELFDPSTRTFSNAAVGSMTIGRMDAGAAPLPNGDVLIAGGGGPNGELSSAEVFNFAGAAVPSGPPTLAPSGQSSPAPSGLSSHFVLHIVRYVRRMLRRGGRTQIVTRRAIISTRRLPSSPVFTTTRANAVLTRRGRVYAIGTAQLARLVLNSRRGLAAGDYSLALRHHFGRRWLTTHTHLTVGS